MAHDPTKWHAWDGTHHHGINPETLLPVFGEPLEDYLGAGFFPAPPWATGDADHPEEHEGYICLYTKRSGLEVDEKGKNIITDVLLFIHSVGDCHHFLKRFHSTYVFAKIGAGVVGVGGWIDFGLCHWQYKEAYFTPLLETDPPGMANAKMLEQQPYRSQTRQYKGDGYLPQFWSGQTLNTISKPFFNPVPQNMLGVGWSTNAKEFFGMGGINDIQVASGADGNRKFQVFNVRLQNLPTARPFNGFTTRFQYLTTAAGPLGVDKVPLTITKEVPTANKGLASLFRRVGQGDPTKAPILEF